MAEQSEFGRGWMSHDGVEFMRRLFTGLLSTLTHMEVHGLENLPEGGMLICPNHLSVVDPPLVFVTLPDRKQTVLVAHKHKYHPLFRPIVTMVDHIWVHRGATSPSTIKAAVRQLQAGSIVGVAPEGTRSRTHALGPGKTGAIFLAYASGVPLVPTAIAGTEKVIPGLLRLRRSKMSITYGKPIQFGEPGRRTRPTPQQLEDGATEVMCHIAAMLPPEYRGLYANHPRTLELLGASDGPILPGPPSRPGKGGEKSAQPMGLG